MTGAATLESTTPLAISVRGRIEMTTACRDADSIPKVANAGCVLVENSERVQIMHNGIRVVADGYQGAWTTEVIERLRGHHEPQEEVVFDAILRQLPARATMIELGGNWSYYSLWFLHDAPATRRSIVLEPDPHHLAIGKRNARLNDRTISFIQGFVGARSEAAVPFQTETAGALTLPMIAVPDVMRDEKIDYLDLLHCDTQGAELAVIESCEQLLRNRRIGFVVFSTHSHHISNDPLTHQRCLFLFQEFGGRILAEHDVHESFSGDGLIAAYFGEDQISWTKPNFSLNRYSTSLFRNPLFDLDTAQRETSALKAATDRNEQRSNDRVWRAEHARGTAESALRNAQRERELVALRIHDLEQKLELAEERAQLATKNRLSAEQQVRELQNELNELRTREADSATRYQAIVASRAWRMTAPLRAAGNLVRRGLRINER